MNNKIWLAAISSLILSNVSVQASEYCGGKSDTVSLKQCAMQEYKLEENRINLVYKELQSVLNRENKQRLKTAQLAWIDFRIKDCDFRTGSETGTIGPLMSISCHSTHTEDRRKLLESILKSEREWGSSN